MKQYLVTGGAGFIGSHIVGALLGQNANDRVLDNFSSSNHNLTDSNFAGCLNVYEGDIRDASKVAEAVRDVDVIFHEAAFVSVPESMEKPLDCFDVNITRTSTLLEAAHKAGVRRVVIASSSAVYGDSDCMPLTEDAPLRPMSPYVLSKRAAKMLSVLYTNSFGLEVVLLRYFNVYGSLHRPDLMYAAAIPIFLKHMIDNRPVTVFGDGGQTREFVFCE